MKQEEWAERLNNHLKDYHQEPSRDLWEGIEASLDKQAKGQTRHIALRRWMMAAAIIGVLFGGAYLMWNNEPVQPQVAQVKATNHADKEEAPVATQADITPDAAVKAPEKLVAQVVTAAKAVTQVANPMKRLTDPRRTHRAPRYTVRCQQNQKDIHRQSVASKSHCDSPWVCLPRVTPTI